ncbi:hypothetical protein [Ramlibacter tataouinensis]|uniref:hypothetical protein n=1 Tax=Ramlibacter tataouinensis TaxID=94132 RepID=UPI0011AE35B6|nr:hypothetical protein [Ramlibacter tataouinensis]
MHAGGAAEDNLARQVFCGRTKKETTRPSAWWFREPRASAGDLAKLKSATEGDRSHSEAVRDIVNSQQNLCEGIPHASPFPGALA